MISETEVYVLVPYILANTPPPRKIMRRRKSKDKNGKENATTGNTEGKC
jgi:hypothetical protein